LKIIRKRDGVKYYKEVAGNLIDESSLMSNARLFLKKYQRAD
jgi:hypothetical protein